jgi:hypothetical protein
MNNNNNNNNNNKEFSYVVLYSWVNEANVQMWTIKSM